MKKAVSLIELVIAIVVIGIAISTIPTVLAQVSDNNEFALKQDAIMAAQTKLQSVIAYDWDENSYYATDDQSYILETSSTNSQLIARAGLTGKIGRRAKMPTPVASPPPNTASSTLGKNSGSSGYNDVDDFNGQEQEVEASKILNAGSASPFSDAKGLDYIFKNNMKLETTVDYISDTGLDFSDANATMNFPSTGGVAGGTSNIKRVTIQVNIDNKKTVQLNSYVFNLGSSNQVARRGF